MRGDVKRGWEPDWRPFLKAVVIFLAGYLAMAPSLGGGWLWDDAEQVTANMALRSAAGLWRIWFAPAEADYFPLKSSVLWGLWHMWGAAPLGYRLFNLCCHLASALLVWRLMKRLGMRWGWLAGLLFAVHPLGVESVAWISEIKNTLSLPFLLAAMLLYIDCDETGRTSTLVLSVLCFLASMLCKSSGVMLPAVLLLFCWWRRGSLSRSDAISALPFAGVSLVLGCVTIWFQETRSVGDNPIPVLGFAAMVAGAGTNAWFYLGKFLAPAGLSPMYPRWNIDPPSAWQLLSLPAGVVLLWLCWMRRCGWGKHALLGLGFFLLNLVPVLGFVKMSFMGYSWVSDHFVYLPMIGLTGLAVAGAEAGYCRLPRLGQVAELAAIGGTMAALVALSGVHAAIFRDREFMWTAVLRVSPEAFAAHNSLGSVYVDEGRLPEALEQFHEALRIRPVYARARNNMGEAFSKSGQYTAALTEFREALRLNPRLVAAHQNMGTVLLGQRKLQEAGSEFRRALAIDPYCSVARNGLGVTLAIGGQTTDAEREFRTALAIDPSSDQVHSNLAIVLAREGKEVEANEEVRKALRINPGNNDARTVLRALQKPEAAIPKSP